MKKNFLMLLLITLLFSCKISSNGMKNQSLTLEGTWELKHISGSNSVFDGLFPTKKPTLIFNLDEKRVSGNSGCNNYSGPFNLKDKNNLDFKERMITTRMMCMDSAQGEALYLETLEKIEKYNISNGGKILNLIINNVVVMRFERKN